MDETAVAAEASSYASVHRECECVRSGYQCDDVQKLCAITALCTAAGESAQLICQAMPISGRRLGSSMARASHISGDGRGHSDISTSRVQRGQ